MSAEKDIDAIKAIKRAHETSWLTLDGVVAVGIGKTSHGITGLIVSVKEDAARFRRVIPLEVDGIPVDIRESGEIRAQ